MDSAGKAIRGTIEISSWRRALGAALLLLGMLGGACSSDPSPPKGNGDIPPPLNQPCSSDTDCESFGLKCDPLRGCLPCVFDWHCAAGERCTDDGCKVPAKCTSDAGCSDNPKAPHCDPVLSECVGCRGESDCPEKSHCVERSCTPYKPCINSRDCAAGTVCDRDAGECVECLGKGDCEKDKEVCVASHCVPVCTSDKDCLARNQLCHHEKGYCADCVEQADCPDVYYCSQDLCKLDICKAGERKCTGSSTFSVCNATGSGVDTVSCPVSTTCSDENGAAVCKPWICTPGTSDCDAKGERVKQCALDGLSFASETDCTADDKLCHLAQCKPKVCEPGTTFCQGSEVRACTANGTDSVLQTACATYQYCDDKTLTCVIQKCTPDSKFCDGNVAVQCDSVGSGPVADSTDCTDSAQVCYDGECRDLLCSGPFCKNGDGWSCSEQGTVAQLSVACSENQYCFDGNCYTDQCTPGEAMCNLQVATTCKADGSGPETDGTDCAEKGKVCDGGVCVPKVCEPSTYYCANGNPQLCNNSGSASSRQTDTCSPSYFCAPGSSYCHYDVCTSGTKFCSGTISTTCAEDGSGPAPGGTDCSLDNKVCYQGTCLPKVCEPNTDFCQGGNSYRCGPTGATSSLNDTCLAAEYCEAGSYYCKPDVCTAGAPTCNGDKLSTCAADGSGPADAGKACTAGKTCFGGACKTVLCTPEALQCSGGNIQRCTDNGTAWSPYATCSASTYCNELASPITCSLDICAPAANACNGEKLAVCDADGGHFSSTTTNCAATNKVCTLSATCAAVAQDSVGDTSLSSASNSYLIGNLYRVDRARKLTEIEQYLSVSGISAFTWVVYEADSNSGSYKKIYEGTTSGSGMGTYFSSGALTVPLSAGKYYLIGVSVQGSFTNYYANSNGTLPFVSFGQLQGSYQTYGAPPATLYVSNIGSRYAQRISTALSP